uniref:C-type lectin domain-containing protein n=1 Tax=Panagrolaimus davidi TaxID=227884 RepID=A0A914QWP7_9BILA
MLILIAFFGIFCFAFGGCPSNSIGLRLNASICYSFHPSLSQYAIAERECNSFGANLVTLNNKYTNVYVTQLANLFFKHLETEEFWTNGHRLMDTKTFRWINGDEIAYDNLLNSHTENDQDCMTVNLEKGFWKHENCFTRLPFVCEFVGDKKEVPPTAIIFETFESFGAFVPLRLKNQFIEKTIIPPSAATTIIEPTTTKPKTCPPSWTYNNVTGYCYNVFHDKSITWMEAEQKCVQEQSHLASVHNKDEVAFVAGILYMIVKCKGEI